MSRHINRKRLSAPLYDEKGEHLGTVDHRIQIYVFIRGVECIPRRTVVDGLLPVGLIKIAGVSRAKHDTKLELFPEHTLMALAQSGYQ